MGQKINLNTATMDDLDQIPAIGKQCAKALIDYRTEHGGIRSIEELDRIPGFGKKAVEHLRENAEV